MPIIVDEVIISVEVGNAAAGGATPPPTPGPSTSEKQAIVEECVERVLEILQLKAER